MYSQNPLVLAVLRILKNNNQVLGLYDLMKELESEGYLLEDDTATLSYDLTMFRKNFIVMNALYQLQKDISDTGYYLYISSLKIALYEAAGSDQTALAGLDIDSEADQKMSKYYLNWDNFESADDDTVKKLLNGFWKRYNDYQNNQNRLDKRLDALRILELESSASWEDIQQSYRKKVMTSHPDKGGSSKYFIEIREAYQTLKFIFHKSQ